MTDMVRDRPRIPAGYGVNTDREGLLSWERVATALTAAEIYWVATAGASGPHLIPIHAVAEERALYFSGDHDTRWARNLASNPAVQIGVEHEGLQVMARGAASLETPDSALHSRLRQMTQSKYGWSHGDEPIPLWIVRPNTVIAFDPAEFAASPTRFSFEETP